MVFILRLDLFSCSLGCAFPHDKGVGRPVNFCHKHIPSGWYWGWSKRLIGTSSNSYRVLYGGMYTVLLYPSLPYWPYMPHLSKSLSSHWCGCVCHSGIGRQLEPSLIRRDCLSNCRLTWLCAGCFMPLYWHRADDCNFVEVMEGVVLFGLPY